MPRSSQTKSPNHSSREVRDYSDSEEDLKFKERNGKEEVSVRISKDPMSGDKRKVFVKDLLGHGNGGDVPDEVVVVSKRRKEKVEGGGSDRWNADGENDVLVDVKTESLNSKAKEKVSVDLSRSFEDKAASQAYGSWPSSVDVNASTDTDVDFAGSKSEESKKEPLQYTDSPKPQSPTDEKENETDSSAVPASEQTYTTEEVDEGRIKACIQPDQGEGTYIAASEGTEIIASDSGNAEADVDSQAVVVGMSESNGEHFEESDSLNRLQQESSEIVSSEDSESKEAKPSSYVDGAESAIGGPHETNNIIHRAEITDVHKTQEEEDRENAYLIKDEETPVDTQSGRGPEPQESDSPTSDESKSAEEISNSALPHAQPSDNASNMVPEMVSHEHDAVAGTLESSQHVSDHESNKGQNFGSDSSDAQVLRAELEKVKKDMQMMETAVQGAARQAQAKADEIAKMMNENEHLKAALKDARVYALTKERDTLHREQNKKSDAAALLKEKDEIINQVMAEGAELDCICWIDKFGIMAQNDCIYVLDEQFATWKEYIIVPDEVSKNVIFFCLDEGNIVVLEAGQRNMDDYNLFNSTTGELHHILSLPDCRLFPYVLTLFCIEGMKKF